MAAEGSHALQAFHEGCPCSVRRSVMAVTISREESERMKAASSSLTFANQGRPRSSGACALAAFGRWSVVTAQPPCSVHGWVGQHKAGTCTQHPIALAGSGGSGCAGGGAATSLRADEATGGGRRAYDSDQLHTSRASSARLCRPSTRARAAARIEAEPTKQRR